ncbi:hypothetical protein ACEPAG_3514 [Sanghuangporus baumii]
MIANSESHVHLVVLVHGLWGNPAHLMELNRHILQRYHTDSSVELLLVSSISDDLTYDGIDWGGERIAQEVIGKIRDIEAGGRAVTKFSTIGYSLGGLVCRYLVGIMRQKGYLQDGSLSTAHYMKPLNFVTIATPHLGIPRYPGLLHSLFSAVGDSLLSRTGRQLCLSDSWSELDTPRKRCNKRPLLEIMADPDQVFYIALSMFENVAVYANAVNDLSVPYMTGAIETQDPFYADEACHIEAELDGEYSPILKSWRAERSFDTREKRRRSVLPSYLRFDFPYNMLIYSLLPLLAPAFIGAAVIRLGISARKSRVRIRALEKDVSFTEALWHSIEVLQNDMQTRDVQPSGLTANVDIQQSEAVSTGTVLEETASSAKTDSRKHLPGFNDKQIAMSRSLNDLPNLRKFLVWIHPIRNSHAHIVCRDIKTIPSQKIGEGVLRHVADHLLI